MLTAAATDRVPIFPNDSAEPAVLPISRRVMQVPELTQNSAERVQSLEPQASTSPWPSGRVLRSVALPSVQCPEAESEGNFAFLECAAAEQFQLCSSAAMSS